ncbi:MAG: hypothetical protein F6K16_31485 [Symploca sp. SIO2B6]|nr:hypothetical protein [Symploca sp. SIO2B6]
MPSLSQVESERTQLETEQSFEFRRETRRETVPLESSVQVPSSQPSFRGIGVSGGQVTAPIWILEQKSTAPSDECPSHAILVAKTITPTWANAIRTAKGVISAEGGLTSHGAILARELGIPAVVGVTNALTYLETGDWVVLDGDRGTITPISPRSSQSPASFSPPFSGVDRLSGVERQGKRDRPLAQQVGEGAQSYSQTIPTWASRSPSLLDDSQTATQLMVSVSQLSTLDHLNHLPLDGVGLIRSELMLAPMLSQQPLEVWLDPVQGSRLLQTIYYPLHQFAEAFAPRPIWYRTLDWRSHEFSGTQDQPSSNTPNPLLSNHGTLSYQRNPTFFQSELEAIKKIQANGLNNVNLLLPFVRTVEEFQFCHQLIQEVGLLDTGKCQVWIMAEIPSILMLLPDYFAAGVQGIAIGSNDLAQLLLAVDRTDTSVQQAFRQDHPAVLRAIQAIIHATRQANRPCSLCGDIVSQHPELIELFIRWGVTTFSVNPDAIATTHHEMIRAEKRLFLEWGRDRF